MNTTDTGGPAFPLYIPAQHTEDHSEVIVGMTLRDYFAAKAMQAHIAALSKCHLPHWNEEVARLSYLVADALLKARKA